MKRLTASVLLGWLMSVPLWAQENPVNPTFAEAFALLEQGDEDAANDALIDATSLEQDLLEWVALRQEDADYGFAASSNFLQKRPDWPGTDRIRAAAERSIDLTVVPAQTVVNFFEDADIVTGEGAVAYARALIALGRRADAEAMLVDTWTTLGLTRDGHLAMINAYPDVLAPHHIARTEMLMWRWRTSDATNMLPLLDEGEQALMRTRMSLIAKASDVAARDALIPERLRGDAGLAYDQFNRLADRGDWTDAVALLTDRSTSAERLGVPWRWGSYRRTLARWQMREGNIADAYRLAAQHYIQPDETNYSDLEWLAGYIALTYLKEYDAALAHFQRFDASVTSPISKGRAGYWLGRTYEGLGNAVAAIQSFQAGAGHQTSFYGLLSAEKLGLTMNPDLVGGENFGAWQNSPVLENELVQAGLALLNAGERGLAVLFFRDAAETMSRQDIGQLSALFMEVEEPFYAILIAKTAVRGDLIVQDAYFPIHPMATLDLPVEPALALAIARQESEFRTDAGSSVGALGLMQLMPATAQEVAGWIDVPYRRARLTTDWEYNAALGAEYLAYLTREFGDSPVMIAAGYNAGPSRPKTWMTERGDPRRNVFNPDPVDVIDWIEHIPFRETRNYVMRVTEGIPVYRARLTGQLGPVAFTDILIGEAPVVRPVARPERVQDILEDTVQQIIDNVIPTDAVAEIETIAPIPPASSGAAVTQSIAPMARPSD